MQALAALRRHLTFANVTSALALFVALSTGTAYAAATITSADIVNGSIAQVDIAPNSLGTNVLKNDGVKSVDIRDGEVTTADVLDATLGAADLAPDSVGFEEIQTDGVQASEIADSSIDSGEIVDFGLTNQDVGVLFAEVSGAGGLDNSSGGVSVVKLSTGQYEVDFGRNVTACTAVATVGPAGGGSSLGEVNVADRGGNVEAVFVDTNTSAGAGSDLPFRLVVVC